MQVRPSRRQFVKQLAVVGSALSIPAASASRVFGANDRLRVASIGAGGKGWSDLNATARQPVRAGRRTVRH